MREAAATGSVVALPHANNFSVYSHNFANPSHRERLANSIKALAHIGDAEAAMHASSTFSLAQKAAVSAEIEECWGLASSALGL